MSRIQLALEELLERLDTSPTVNIGKDGRTLSVTNEQYNHMQCFTIFEVVRKHGLTMVIDFTVQRPHPAIVINITDNNPVEAKGHMQDNRQYNDYGLTL